MADQSMEISDKAIGRLPYAESGQFKVLDTELKGFVVVIGRRKKTFAAQGAFWRDGVREFAARKKIGEFGAVKPSINRDRPRRDAARWQPDAPSAPWCLGSALFGSRSPASPPR